MSVVVESRDVRTIHRTSWKEAWKAGASTGKAAVVMLVSNDGISIESERLATARVRFDMRQA
jgi:hypothetical protein